jgi:hypothetical protein
MMISSIALLVHLISFKFYILHNDMIIKTTQNTFNVSKGKICWDIETIITGGLYYKGLYF